MLGVGIVIGILAVVGVIKLTMREEPTGCVVVFGSLFLLIFVALIVVPWVVLAV